MPPQLLQRAAGSGQRAGEARAPTPPGSLCFQSPAPPIALPPPFYPPPRYQAAYRELARKHPSFRERSETTELIVDISLQVGGMGREGWSSGVGG
jgi:hypothetical protein